MHDTRPLRRRSLMAVCAAGVALSILGTGGAPTRASAVAAHRPPFLLTGAGRVFAGTALRTTTASAACAKASQVVCSQVDVPLDRTGAVPGTIPLHVEVLPNKTGVQRGVIFLVAGGPGQGSAHTFDLGNDYMAAFFRYLFPGYTLVAYDDRGTGSSGLLGCPALQNAFTAEQAAQLIADCAAKLGTPRAFYSTADHAEDLEAVRQALGFDRIAIWGVSYGTKLALAYALAHPEHVERLLLDSIVQPDSVDPFGTGVLQAMPATLASYCDGGACRAATSDFAGDVATVANRLAAKPLESRVLTTNGKTISVRLNSLDFLGMVVEEDLSPGLAAELPAAVRAARDGRPRPILHAFELTMLGGGGPAADVSLALYLATVCRDGPFPWQPDTPVTDRPALVQAAVAALPAGSFGPFGSWAAGFGNIELCVGWPSPTGGATLGAGPLPDVPMLALSGGLDLRTPTAGAASVVARFPQGHLLVVPGIGHSVLTADPSGCSQHAVRSWILSGAPPTTCARPKQYVTALGSFPRAAPKRLHAAQTRAVAAKTLHEAEAVWLMAAGSGRKVTVPGVYSGQLRAGSGAFTLLNYSITPGLTLTGIVTLRRFGPPLGFEGLVIVEGAKAAHGVLHISGTRLRGTLSVAH
jgi:pimeloyl-ACP methyl ester carboxylesterase